jgi:hypothetical protein
MQAALRGHGNGNSNEKSQLCCLAGRKTALKFFNARARMLSQHCRRAMLLKVG